MDIEHILNEIDRFKDHIIQLHERNKNLVTQNNRLKNENERLCIDLAFYDKKPHETEPDS